jgi:hypothetical protein
MLEQLKGLLLPALKRLVYGNVLQLYGNMLHLVSYYLR